MIRIVKLTFKPECRQEFIDFISVYKDQITSFKGCGGVQFLNDISNPTIFFTYSYWDDATSLQNYRDSELFAHVWGTVKQWFDDKAEAWSVDNLFQ